MAVKCRASSAINAGSAFAAKCSGRLNELVFRASSDLRVVTLDQKVRPHEGARTLL